MIGQHVYTVAAAVALFALVVASVVLLFVGKFGTMLLCLLGAAMLVFVLRNDYRKCQDARKRKILLG